MIVVATVTTAPVQMDDIVHMMLLTTQSSTFKWTCICVAGRPSFSLVENVFPSTPESFLRDPMADTLPADMEQPDDAAVGCGCGKADLSRVLKYHKTAIVPLKRCTEPSHSALPSVISLYHCIIALGFEA